MIPTITSFTQKILAKYPTTQVIHLDIHDATHNTTYDTWTGDIAEVILDFQGLEQITLSPEDYYDLFNTMTYIRLGKNNKSRQIDSKHVFHVEIYTELETFTTKDGKTISYYPTSSDIITSKEYLDEIRSNSKILNRELIKLSKNKSRLPNLSDLPDFD